MNRYHMPNLLLVVAATALLWAAACSNNDPASAPASDPATAGVAPAAPVQPGQTAGVTPGQTAPDQPEAPAPKPPPPPARAQLAAKVIALVADWSAREKAFVSTFETRFKTALTRKRWFRQLTTKAYEERQLELIFSDASHPNKTAETMLTALQQIDAHGLDPEPYEREELQGVLDAIGKHQAAYDGAVEPAQDAQVGAIWNTIEAVREMGGVPSTGAVERLLEGAGLDDKALEKAAVTDARMKKILETKQALNDTLIDLDIRLLGAWFRYTYDMRYAKRAHPFDADSDDGAGVTRVKDALYEAYTTTDFAKLGAQLAELEPKHPDYRKLMQGLAFYRELAKTAEVAELSRAAEKLKPGRKGKLVKELQQRLMDEKYYSGEISGTFDDATEAALLLYQTTHQLKETGAMDRSSRSSLNKSFKVRAEQLELGLMRHRESDLHQGEWRFGTVPLLARVNIPQFEAVFFRDGEPGRVHRVVVGNNAIETDENTGAKGYFNRTRMFSKEMQTIVINPVWRVPRRIKEQELDRSLIDEPDYYEKHNYKVRILDDGSEEVVQQPGPNNALGLVKFLFPNQFSIYMHDTPKKRLFKREIRAFSHGCMRVHGALDLARWVLGETNEWSEERFDRVVEKRETYGVALKTKVPVTIDYNTVGVHESGHMMFFLDVYRFDRDYFAGRIPYKTRQGRTFEQVVLAQ